jgi:hypothetical protein
VGAGAATPVERGHDRHHHGIRRLAVALGAEAHRLAFQRQRFVRGPMSIERWGQTILADALAQPAALTVRLPLCGKKLELLWLFERDQDRLLQNLVQLRDGCVCISLRLKLYLGIFRMILVEIANPHYRFCSAYHRSHSHVLPLH